MFWCAKVLFYCAISLAMVRDVEAPGDLNERLTSSATTKGFCALVGGKGWLTTKPNASSLRSSAALCGSGEDEMALIFRQPT
jgi:hypothetical protein